MAPRACDQCGAATELFAVARVNHDKPGSPRVVCYFCYLRLFRARPVRARALVTE